MRISPSTVETIITAHAPAGIELRELAATVVGCLNRALDVVDEERRAFTTVVLLAPNYARDVVVDYVSAFAKQRGKIRPSQSTALELTKLIDGFGPDDWRGNFFALADDVCRAARTIMIRRAQGTRDFTAILLEVRGASDSEVLIVARVIVSPEVRA